MPAQSTVDTAGPKIARFWRRFSRYSTAKLVHRYFECVTMSGTIPSASFEGIIAHLKLASVKLAAKACLNRIFRLCKRRHGLPRQYTARDFDNLDVFSDISTRKILSTYMIVYHKQRVLESTGDRERALIASSEQFLLQLHTILDAIRRSTPSHFAAADGLDTACYLEAYAAFRVAFSNWQGIDKPFIVVRIRNALLALYSARVHLPPDDYHFNNGRLRTEFAYQISRLREKYLQIAGAAELAAFDTANQVDAVEIPVQAPQRDQNSPDPFTGARLVVDRIQVAHEILVNPDFKLSDTCDFIDGSSHHQQHLAMRDEFWGNLRTQLHARDYTNAVRILSTLRDTMANVCKEQDFPLIQEALPMHNIQELAAQDHFAWEDIGRLCGAVSGLVRIIIDPTRVDQFNAGWAQLAERMDAAPEDDRMNAFADALALFADTSFKMSIDSMNTR